MSAKQTREGRIEKHDPRGEDSVWVACHVESDERAEIQDAVSRRIRLDDIPRGSRIGTVTIEDGTPDVEIRDRTEDEFGWD